MTRRRSLAFLVWCVALTALASPTPALAYLDPTTGSMLLQLILGGVAGIAVAFKLFWHRVRSSLSSRKSDDNQG